MFTEQILRSFWGVRIFSRPQSLISSTGNCSKGQKRAFQNYQFAWERKQAETIVELILSRDRSHSRPWLKASFQVLMSWVKSISIRFQLTVDSLIEAKLLIIWWGMYTLAQCCTPRVLFQLLWNFRFNELKGCCSNHLPFHQGFAENKQLSTKIQLQQK